MATYAVGDVQGCMTTLERLLARIRFDRAHDRLWLVGDLVNRGPRSLDVLRFARALGEGAVCVLGNHDVHLIARAEGLAPAKRRDTIDDVLAAPDRDTLIAWLRSRPLAHRAVLETEAGRRPHLMVHAGLLSAWTVDEAERRARLAEAALRGPGLRAALAGQGEAAEALGVFIRLRTLDAEDRMGTYDGEPQGAPPGFMPWFDHPARRSTDATIVFGHWSALGLCLRDNLVGLDTGCVWGRALTAVRLEDRAVYSEPAAEPAAARGG